MTMIDWSPQMRRAALILAYICVGYWELPDDPFDPAEWFDAEVR